MSIDEIQTLISSLRSGGFIVAISVEVPAGVGSPKPNNGGRLLRYQSEEGPSVRVDGTTESWHRI